MKSGIYKITIGRWFYWGSTKNFTKRKAEHLSCLRLGKHRNPILQNAYNKHLTFEFEECSYEQDLSLLSELEQLVIDQSITDAYCANINPVAHRPPSFIGRNHSEETKTKISSSQKGRTLTEEHKAKLSAAKKDKKGRAISEETKAKISAANKGRKRSEEAKIKMSKARTNYLSQQRKITNAETNAD
jgi:group I intron endonuclease